MTATVRLQRKPFDVAAEGAALTRGREGQVQVLRRDGQGELIVETAGKGEDNTRRALGLDGRATPAPWTAAGVVLSPAGTYSAFAGLLSGTLAAAAVALTLTTGRPVASAASPARRVLPTPVPP